MSQCCPWEQKLMIIGTDLKNPLWIWNQRFVQQPFSCGEAFQCCAWQQTRMIISTDFKRSASNLKPKCSATTIYVWWPVSMLCMISKTYDNLYWNEEVFFEPETNGFCNNRSLMVKHLNFVHDSQSLRSTVLIWRGLLQIGNQRSPKQQLYVCETSQCFWWQPKPMMIGTDLKWPPSNLKRAVSATTIFLIVKRLSLVHNSQNPGTSVLIWRGLLQIWTKRFLQQPFSYCETSQCCPWQPKPGIIGTGLKGSASNLKPTISATTIVLLSNVSVLSMTANHKDHLYWFEEICFESETTGFCSNHVLNAHRFNAVHDNKILGSSVMIWRGLLRIWNRCVLRQLFSYGEPCQCCPRRREPRKICADLNRSASNMKPTVSAATVLLWWNVSMLSMTTKA